MNVCDLLGKLADLLETRIKTKKIHCVLEFNQSQQLKLYIEFNTHTHTHTHTQNRNKKTTKNKKTHKDGKTLYKSINNAIYEKAMEDLRNRIKV